MLSDLCRLTTSEPKQVVGDLISFTVTNSDLKNEADNKFFYEEKYTSRDDLVEKNSFVSFLCIVWWALAHQFLAFRFTNSQFHNLVIPLSKISVK